MSAKAIPDGFDALIPSKVVRDAAKAIEFYKEVFGATEIMRMNYPDSPKIAHAEIKIRNHVLMLGDENPQMGAFAPPQDGKMPSSSVMIYVADVDTVFSQAIAAGAKEQRPVKDQFYGDRSGTLEDPFGHDWHVATHTEDNTPDEMERRASAHTATTTGTEPAAVATGS